MDPNLLGNIGVVGPGFLNQVPTSWFSRGTVLDIPITRGKPLMRFGSAIGGASGEQDDILLR